MYMFVCMSAWGSLLLLFTSRRVGSHSGGGQQECCAEEGTAHITHPRKSVAPHTLPHTRYTAPVHVTYDIYQALTVHKIRSKTNSPATFRKKPNQQATTIKSQVNKPKQPHHHQHQ